jgi:hypothetical protein
MKPVKKITFVLMATLMCSLSSSGQETQTPPNGDEREVAPALDQVPSIDSNGPPVAAEDETLKYTKFGNKTLIWVLYGVGSPGNGLDSPSGHIEFGLDLSLNERMKWGPYYQLVTANKKESFVFSATGYSEVRKYLVTANVIGVQSRVLLHDVWQGRLGFGLSQTSMEVKSASTDAPLPSTAVGYKKTFPIGLAFQATVQRVWVLKAINLAAEAGYNITALNANESFTEAYLGVIARFTIGSGDKTPMLKPRGAVPDSSSSDTSLEGVAAETATSPQSTESPAIEPSPAITP